MSEWRRKARGRETCSRLSPDSRGRNCTGKYIVYQEGTGSKGGMGNQKVFFSISAVIARYLERELIVPPFCTHWVEACILADYVWDFEYFNSFNDSHAIPIPEFVVYWMQDSDVFEFFTHIASPDDDLVYSALYDPQLEEKRKAVFAADLARSKSNAIKPFAYPGFPKLVWYQPFTSRIRMAPVLRETVINAMKASFSNARENYTKLTCIHIRWGDRVAYFWKNDKKKSIDYYLNFALRQGIGKNDEVYIATEGLTADLLATLEGKFSRVHHSYTLFPARAANTLVTNFADNSHRAPLTNDIVGALETLLCACADQFIGTPDSTFSSMIVDFRSNLRELFPECHEWYVNVRNVVPSANAMPTWMLNWSANHE